jgi:hypothetical protein
MRNVSLVDLAAAEAVTTILVATAAADLGNLRFYQRQGFRMRSIERDAFTTATGYPPGLCIDGIELRDRVWLDRAVLASVHGVQIDPVLRWGSGWVRWCRCGRPGWSTGRFRRGAGRPSISGAA